MSPRPRISSFGLHRYGPTLRTPGARRILAGTFVFRAGQFGNGLAILLAVHAATGSYGVAGSATGSMAAGLAAGRIVQGRLVDRVGATWVLTAAATLFVLASAGLVAITATDASTLPVLAVSALVGFTLPGVDAVTRTLWAAIASGSEARLRAYALDAMTVEVAAMAGPTVAGLIATTLSPALALAVMATMTAGGTLVVAMLRLTRANGPRRRGVERGGIARPLLAPLAIMLGIGLMAGGIEVAITAFATVHDSAGATGPLFAAWSAGSAFGGIWYGARTWRTHSETRLVACLACMTVSCGALALAPSIAVLGVLLALSGAPVSCAITTLYVAVDEYVPHERLTEAFGWLTSAIPTGVALGTVMAGWTVSAASPQAALALAAVVSLIALVAGAYAARAAAVARRRHAVAAA